MGAVFTAEDTLVGMPIAVKIIHPQFASAASARAMLMSELRLARLVSHSNLCRLHDAGECEANGEPIVFLTMELLQGETLAERLKRRPRIPLEEAKAFAAQMVAGVAALHATGVIHGDLKPGNVMLTGDAGLRAVVTDFGLSRYAAKVEPSESSADAGAGTPAYMAPERHQGGAASCSADVYALGLAIAQTITGLDLHYIVDVPALQGPTGLSVAADAVLKHAGAAGLWLRPPASDVTVLPFANSTGDSRLDYAAEGISQSLQQNLTRFPELQVGSWSASRRFRGPQPDAAAIRAYLHAKSFITGELKRKNGDLSLTVELVDAANGEGRWMRTYQRQDTELADLEASVLTDISPRLVRRPGAVAASAGTNDAAVYDLYLRGLYLMNRRSPADFDSAAADFSEAATRAPDYALPHAGLADLYWMLAEYVDQNPAAMLPKSKEEARRALELDPTLAEAHKSYAMALAALDFYWKGAEAEFLRAIQLNPRLAEAHGQFAVNLLAPQKRFAEAILEARRAVDLEPHEPIHRLQLAYVLYFARHFDPILSQLDKVSQSPWPQEGVVRKTTGALRAVALAGLGRYQDSIAALDATSAIAISPDALPIYPTSIRP